MNQQEIRGALTALIAAYPSAKLSEETLRLWGEILGPLHSDDVAVAVERWVTTEEWFPVPARFLDYVHDETTSRHRAELLAESGVKVTKAIRPREGELIVDERYKHLADALALLGEKHADDHREGAENCATCGPVIRGEEGVHTGRTVDDCPECQRTMTPVAQPLYRCAGGCEDQGMVYEGDALRPCATCNRDSYDLWLNGCYEPNHRGCEACRPQRRRKKKADA